LSQLHDVPMCRQRIDPGEWAACGGTALGDRAEGSDRACGMASLRMIMLAKADRLADLVAAGEAALVAGWPGSWHTATTGTTTSSSAARNRCSSPTYQPGAGGLTEVFTLWVSMMTAVGSAARPSFTRARAVRGRLQEAALPLLSL
jgi:hypothetical protein